MCNYRLSSCFRSLYAFINNIESLRCILKLFSFMNARVYHAIGLLRSPAYRYFSLALRRLLYFTRVILFFPPRHFSTSLNRYSRNFTTRCGMSLHWLFPMDVFICAPRIIWGTKTPNIANLPTLKSTLWAPLFHNAREIGKSKTIAPFCG